MGGGRIGQPSNRLLGGCSPIMLPNIEPIIASIWSNNGIMLLNIRDASPSGPRLPDHILCCGPSLVNGS